MPIRTTLDLVMTQRRITGKELAAIVGVTEQNLSLLRTGKVKGVRFSTLEKLCEALSCQPGDLLVFEAPPEDE
ncbi:MAG: helix-turn-helix transcriptional regulator [Pseudomonadota bacterium]